MTESTRAEVLLVEDTPSLSQLYLEYLKREPYRIRVVETGKEALAALAGDTPHVVLLDLMLPDMEGMEILRHIRQHGIPVTVIVITAHGSVNMAVECMREGAKDFIMKPFNADRLKVTLKNAVEHQKLEHLVETIKDDFGREGYCGFIGRSLSMQSIYRIIDSAATSKATVFVTGESGTGKEVCAEAVHRQSPRRSKPFIALNCAAIPRDLIESEIFGHVKGAFTGATADRDGAAKQADGGTLFLDEICEMDLDLQSKLLRFIQTGTFTKVGGSRTEAVDVRFVCATNRDPMGEVRAGRFREDLYYRLHVIPIQLPALRDREDDVLLIARTFLFEFAKEEKKAFARFNREVEARILGHSWPGNVRELQNFVRNIVVLNDGEEVSPQMLPAGFAAAPAPASAIAPLPPAAQAAHPGSAPMVQPAPAATGEVLPLHVVERRAIEQAIEACGGNIPKAAALLDVSPSTIYRKKMAWQD